jgi:hypothetical protein
LKLRWHWKTNLNSNFRRRLSTSSRLPGKILLGDFCWWMIICVVYF